MSSHERLVSCLGLTEAGTLCVTYSVLERIWPLSSPLKFLGPWCLKDFLDFGYFQDPKEDRYFNSLPQNSFHLR